MPSSLHWTAAKPGIFDQKGRYKWDAWEAKKGKADGLERLHATLSLEPCQHSTYDKPKSIVEPPSVVIAPGAKSNAACSWLRVWVDSTVKAMQ